MGERSDSRLMPAQDSWRMTGGSLAISNYYLRKDPWMFPPVRELQKLSLKYQSLHPADTDTARRVLRAPMDR